MLIHADIINKMINAVIVEYIVTVFCCILAKYFFDLKKSEAWKVYSILFSKMYFINLGMTYCKGAGIEIGKDNIFAPFLGMYLILFMLVSIKLITGRRYTNIFLYKILIDIFGVILVMMPYNFWATYVLKSEPIFYGEGFVPKNMMLYGVFLIYCMVILYFFVRFCQKVGPKVANRRYRHAWIIWGAMLIQTGIGSYGYLSTEFRYDARMILYYVVAVGLNILVMYESFVYERHKKAKRIQRENYALTIENTVMKEYYATMKNQLEKHRKFRHDIDKHMMVMQEMLKSDVPQEEIADYATAIQEEYDKLGVFEYCKHPVVNAILQNKARQCEQKQIAFDVQITQFELGQIKTTDSIALLANLIDNAIEECERISADVKKITLKIGVMAGNLMIKIENSTDKKEGVIEQLKTSKADKYAHGMGMVIVKDIIEKYCGTLYMEVRNGMFHTMVGLVLEEE